MKKFHKDYSPSSMEYQGAYYLFKVSKEEKIKLITVHTIFTLIQLGLLIFAGLLNNPGNRNFFIAVPYAFLFFPYVYLIMSLFSFAKMEHRMEAFIYDKAFARALRCLMAVRLLSLYMSAADMFFLLQLESKGKKIETVYLLVFIFLFMLSLLHWKYLQKWHKKVIITKNKTH